MMIYINADHLSDGLYNVKNGEIFKYKAKGGTVRAYKLERRSQGEVDAIDRDALIDYCLKLIDVERKQGSDVMNYGQERVNQTEAIIDYIEHMPHVNADRPQGEWIFKTVFPNDKSEFPMGYLVCSVCGAHHSNSTPCTYCDNLCVLYVARIIAIQHLVPIAITAEQG